jgi:tetratricopeptide (TPR) repeat protein
MRKRVFFFIFWAFIVLVVGFFVLWIAGYNTEPIIGLLLLLASGVWIARQQIIKNEEAKQKAEHEAAERQKREEEEKQRLAAVPQIVFNPDKPLKVEFVGALPPTPSPVVEPPAPMIKPMPEISGQFPYHEQHQLKLIGRDKEVTDIENALQEPMGIFITGVGGIGKTRLSVEIATRALTAFADKIIWLRLEHYVRLETLVELSRNHVGLPITATPDAVQAALAQKQVLIIVDNAEECADTAAFTTWLFGINPAGGTRWLINGRSVWHEMAHKVREIAIQPPQQPQAILQAMAKISGVDEKIAGKETEITQLARHHPRLLWYAVGWQKDFPVTEVITMLRDLPQTASIDVALNDIVQRTLNRIQQVDGELPLAALRQLAVCRGGFTLEAAKALIGDTQPLRVLRRWHLLTLTNERYALDPLAAHVAGEDAAAYAAHFDYYKALAKQHDEKQDYLGLDIESDNLNIAFARACEQQQWEKAYWFYNACSFFLGNRGRFEQRKLWLEQVARALGIIPPSGNSVGARHASPLPNITDYLRASIHNDLGIVYQNMPTGNRRENLNKAIAAYQQALIYWTPETAPLAYAMTQNNLGTAYSDLAQLENQRDNLRNAIAAYQQALQHYTPTAAPLAYAMTQNNLGTAYRDLAQLENQRDNLQNAIAAHQQALIYWTPETAPQYYAVSQNNLGTAYWDLSKLENRRENLQNALECYQQAAQYANPASSPYGYAISQHGCGNIYQDLGEIDKAIACWREAETYYRQMGHVELADRVKRAIEAATSPPDPLSTA